MKKIFFILLILIISLPSLWSIFHSGFFQSDDGEWMVIRFSAFHQALRDGQFPVRFLGRLNYGYGYPVSNFLYPGFMYLSEPIKILGFSFVNTIKIILGLSLFGSAIFTFFWLSKLFKKLPALIGATFYLYTPYHLFDLYKRGSVGEILSLAFVPFVLWMIERKSLIFTAIGIFLLVISHNTLTLLFLPVLFIYSILRTNIKFTLISSILGILMSSFFLIPAISELSYTNFSTTKISDFGQYFAPIELIGISTLFLLSFTAVSIYDFFKKVEPLNKTNKLFILMLVLAVFSIFLSSKISLFFWNYIPSSFIQFPFRFLSYIPLSLAFLSAFILSKTKEKKRLVILITFLFVLSFSAFPYLKPAEFFDKGDSFYATNEGTTTVRNEYLPKWVKVKPTEHFKQKAEILSGEGEISNLRYNSGKISFNIALQNNSPVRINTIYYPGWESFIDGMQSKIEYRNKFGVMDVSVPKGQHSVKLSFSETPPRLFADFISLSSLMVLIIYSFRKFYCST